jgi:hypothetical protein
VYNKEKVKKEAKKEIQANIENIQGRQQRLGGDIRLLRGEEWGHRLGG